MSSDDVARHVQKKDLLAIHPNSTRHPPSPSNVCPYVTTTFLTCLQPVSPPSLTNQKETCKLRAVRSARTASTGRCGPAKCQGVVAGVQLRYYPPPMGAQNLCLLSSFRSHPQFLIVEEKSLEIWIVVFFWWRKSDYLRFINFTSFFFYPLCIQKRCGLYKIAKFGFVQMHLIARPGRSFPGKEKSEGMGACEGRGG